MGKLIAVDLDGTLFYPKHRFKLISDKCASFIRRRIDKGDNFVVVSGRNGDFGQKVIKRVGRTMGIIGCNGSLIMDGDKPIKLEGFDPKLAREAIEWIRNNTPAKGLFVMTSDYKFILEKFFKDPFYNIGYYFCNINDNTSEYCTENLFFYDPYVPLRERDGDVVGVERLVDVLADVHP